MVAIKRFLFETSFDSTPAPEPKEEPAVTEAEPVPPAPTFSEEDVNAARGEGFAAGKEEGTREAATAIEARIAEGLTVIAERLAQLFGSQEEANEAAVRHSVGVAAAIARKLFPDLDRRHALGEIERLVETVIGQVLAEPRVVIRVPERLHAGLAPRVEALAAARGYPGKIVMLADAGLPEGDCRIEWTDGGADRDTAALWREIDAIIERNIGAGSAAAGEGAQPTTPEHGVDEPRREGVDEPAAPA